MSRTIRKTATATIVITASSDTVDSLPTPSPPTAAGAEATREYIGNLSGDELATLLENAITEWATESFPREIRKQFLDLVSVSVSIA